MGTRKPRLVLGPETQTSSLLFSMMLTLMLSLTLTQDSELLCPQDLNVTMTESESPSGPVILSCKGCSHFPHSSFLYWLGNHSFIEHLPGRLREEETRRQRLNSVTLLQRDVVLEERNPQLLNTNFSCVLVDPAGVFQHHILPAQVWRLRTSQTPSLGTSLTTSRPREESRTSNQA